MDIKTLLPDEYKEISNANLGWQKFTMTSASIQLDQNDVIDEVSALPTPWARMQFVEMAFAKWQGHLGKQKKLTVEEKRVINYTFDLLELIFFQDHYNVRLAFAEIPEFNENNYFSRATNTFFQFPKPTLIKAAGSNGTFVLLGSTSPYTLVYPAFHHIKQSYPLGQGRNLFDADATEIILLRERPKQFLAYLKDLGESLPEQDSINAFKRTLGTINYSAQNISADFARPWSDSLLQARLNGNEEVQIKKLEQAYKLSSDFFYAGNKIIIGDHHNKGTDYLKDFPLSLLTRYDDLVNLSRDILPNTIIKQQWLHESDLFTPKLLGMPYDLNGDSFYLGETDETLNKRFAPPLSDAYFDNENHWNVDMVPNFVTSLKIVKSNLKIKASVQIELQKENTSITVSKTYEKGDVNTKDVVESAFAVKVFPNFYISNRDENDHRQTIGAFPYFLSLYDESGIPSVPIVTSAKIFDTSNKILEPSSCHVRKKKTYLNSIDALINYELKDIPRRIKVTMEIGASKENYSFSLLPSFERKKYNEIADAGIRIGFDFGTTNSAIAYSYVGANNDIIVANFQELKENTTYFPKVKVRNETDSYEDVFSKYSFELSAYKEVFRSVINFATGIASFADWVNFNIYLYPEIKYNKDSTPNEIQRTEFKWDINNARYQNQAKEWVAHFISCNLILLKYLMLQEERNMNLKDVELIWFYPLAFDESLRNTIREIWQSQKIFPSTIYQEMDESIAPFINSTFYSTTNSTKVINIDIGGGTTDVCMLKGTEPLLKLSLPLAGRNILGDLYGETNKLLSHNAIVWSNTKPPIDVQANGKKSHEHFITQTPENKKRILENASPIIYFFGYCILKYIKLTIDANIPTQGSQKDNYPDTIRFSGNGSKMFAAILSNEGGINYIKLLKNRQHSFNKMVKLIFKKEIEIEYSSNLKEDTVKGGVTYLINKNDYEDNPVSSAECEIVGENINGISFNSKLNKLHGLENGIEISTENSSYLLTGFLNDFLEMLETEAALFDTLFLTNGEAKRLKLIKYIKTLVANKSYTNLQNYISGGIKYSGVSISKLKSSLLMFELQGIINEMTREV